ncbi:MAG: YbaK/EbsC family protein [Gammaproteobacteria bacterium]|jgi:prolyl-tRNA editing enzyme YbaK/EbsC (Cys-tRNA(Pro) deacylase)
MSDTLPEIYEFLESCGYPFEIWPCDPELADTAVFCEHYGVSLANSANAILVRSKTGERKFVVCVLLATDRLNTNHTVRKKMGARKVSFASADETRELTGMEIGGVTPLALAGDLPIWIDDAVMACDYVVLGGGNRNSKIKLDPRALLEQSQAEVVEGLAKHD